jgi:hypothetical protein
MSLETTDSLPLSHRAKTMDRTEKLRKLLTENPRNKKVLCSFEDLLTGFSRNELLQHWSWAFTQDTKSKVWLQEAITTAMRSGLLQLAGQTAELYALLRWGAQDYVEFRNAGIEAPFEWPTKPYLTHPKLRHDIEHFEYLRKNEILDPALLLKLVARYEAVDTRLLLRGGERQPLEAEDHEQIGQYYNRILHLRSTPPVDRALSPAWNRTDVQNMYLDRGSGVVVIDNFLTTAALEELRAFCLESTIWFANRYAHGRLGAFLHDGFVCPLLIQVAKELRQELPAIFLPQYPLTQVWAFKNTQHLPASSTTHADFAAVTANLWITPDSANTIPEQGGLTIYSVDAPLHWDFATYNGRSDVIRSFLDSQGTESVIIPYRQNRTVIFNADLFHGTQEVRFKSGYENHRINVSWLYGRREDDIHHRAAHSPIATHRSVRSWRSAGLRRFQ